MPLFYQHNINASTKLGVWHITESEDFFLKKVTLQQAISHPHKRLQHLAGRFLLRFLFPEFPHDLIEIASTHKPYLPDEAFHFSISHCGDYAAAIVSSTNRVGIDIEIPTPKVDRVRHKFLHVQEMIPFEKEQIPLPPSLPPTENNYLRKLTLLWSAKEAVFKWYGAGEINFAEQIRVEHPGNFIFTPERGVLQGRFVKEQNTQLILPYINFDALCLVWVIT